MTQSALSNNCDKLTDCTRYMIRDHIYDTSETECADYDCEYERLKNVVRWLETLPANGEWSNIDDESFKYNYNPDSTNDTAENDVLVTRSKMKRSKASQIDISEPTNDKNKHVASRNYNNKIVTNLVKETVATKERLQEGKLEKLPNSWDISRVNAGSINIKKYNLRSNRNYDRNAAEKVASKPTGKKKDLFDMKYGKKVPHLKSTGYVKVENSKQKAGMKIKDDTQKLIEIRKVKSPFTNQSANTSCGITYPQENNAHFLF